MKSEAQGGEEVITALELWAQEGSRVGGEGRGRREG